MGRWVRPGGLGVLASVLGVPLVLCASASAIPTKVRAELLKDARREAAKPPFLTHHPLDVRAVLTTEAQAWALENKSRKVDLACGSCGTEKVYLVAMLGSSRDCKSGPGALPSCPSHPPVFMFWVSPSTMKVSRAARASSYPNLTSAGVPVSLESG